MNVTRKSTVLRDPPYIAVWRALQVCEDEPVGPRVSVSSEGFVLEGHESDLKVDFTNGSLN